MDTLNEVIERLKLEGYNQDFSVSANSPLPVSALQLQPEAFCIDKHFDLKAVLIRMMKP